MKNEFWLGLAIPAGIAVCIKMWEFANSDRHRQRDLMQKILLQLERHEVLFQSMQQDIHELREKL
nr:hypothetical protein [Nostoc sp. EkiNYC01]